MTADYYYIIIIIRIRFFFIFNLKFGVFIINCLTICGNLSSLSCYQTYSAKTMNYDTFCFCVMGF